MDTLQRALNGRSGLWRNQDFLRFWIGETVSNFGAQLGGIALPIIAAVTLDASPFEMGLLAASTNLPRMIVGIFAGTWVDRRKRRPIMISVNLLRAMVYLSIPIFAMLDMLTFSILLGMSVLLGILGILFDSAWSAMIPNLVDRDDLADANGKLWASMSVAQILGPAVAGSLIAWITGPNVLALTAIGLLVSAWYMHLIQRPEPDMPISVHASPREIIQNIREGYVELVRNTIVWPLTTTLVGNSFGSGVFSAVFVLFLTNELGLSTRGVGTMFAVAGLGALTGSLVAAPLARRFGYGRIIVIGPFIQGTCNLMFTVAVFADRIDAGLVAVALYVGWIFLQAYDINRFSLRQAVTRPNLMGRVASSTMTMIAAVSMLGSLIGGTVGEIWGLAPALALGALVQIATGFLTVFSPVPAIRTLPAMSWHDDLTDIHSEPAFPEPDPVVAKVA